MFEISGILNRLKFSLYLMFMILTVIAVYLVVLLRHSAQELNDVSAEISTAIFDSVINKELSDTGTLTKDYAFWSDAVEKLGLTLDDEFVEDNFYGSYMGDSFGVNHVIIADLQQNIKQSLSYGEVDTVSNPHYQSAAYQQLMQQALQTDLTDPEPAMGFTLTEEGIQIVACVAITPHDDQDPRYQFGKAYGFLLISKPLDDERLAGWEADFRFDSVSLVRGESIPEGYLSKPIFSSTGEKLANVIWLADRPGTLFIHDRFSTVALILVVMLVITIFFLVNVRRYMDMGTQMAAKLEKNQTQLNALAYFDRLTGLPNRTLALDRLLSSLKTPHEATRFVGVMFIDLDGFKPINDRYGHAVGDRVLAAVAQRLNGCVQKSDTVARLGGDEFLLILETSKAENINNVAQRVINALRIPFRLDDLTLQLSASIGIAIAPQDGQDPDELIIRADKAMYQSKSKGKNCYQYFCDKSVEAI